ncbi:MAG: hypothetical protein Q4G39_05415, partial [Brachymonas sp.]|nr:hypothetical protein [Brachymonas sp.]
MKKQLFLLFLLLGVASFPPDASAQQTQIYRCGNTYSNKPCSGGKKVEMDKVSTIPGDEAEREKILECRDAAGIYWTRNDACKQGDTELGAYTAPRGLSLKEQVYIAKMKKQVNEQLVVPNLPTASAGAGAASAAAADAGAEKPISCAEIAQSIKTLDEARRSQHDAGTAEYFARRRTELVEMQSKG